MKDTPYTDVQKYIDKVSPRHDRRSCIDYSGEPTLYNAKYDEDDSSSCLRCTLLYAIGLAPRDDVPLGQ